MHLLTYVHDSKRVEVPLTGNPVSLGRGEDAGHRLPCKVASRLHAQVFMRDGKWAIEDLGSSNGTILNGKKISGITPLAAGDKIRIGTIELSFEGEPPAPLYKPEEEKIARLLYKPEAGKPHEALITERITLGRAKDNVLDIEHKSVSSHHCYVEPRGKQYVLCDLGSSNGTFIGDKQITEHVLSNGDVILLGKVVKVYFIDPVQTPGSKPVSKPISAPTLPVQGSAPRAARPISGQHTVPPAGAESVEPAAPPQPAAAGAAGVFNVLIGVLLAGALGAGAWFGAEMLKPPPAAAPKGPEVPPALEIASLSFEGEVDNQGNPSGWTLASEAPRDATLELMSDGANPGDGRRCLRIARGGVMTEPALVSLTHREATALPGESWRISIMLRGEGVTALCISAGVQGERGYTAAVTSGLTKLAPGEWTQYRANGLLLDAPRGDVRLALQVSGVFSRLWIDRFFVEAGPAAVTATPAASAGKFKLQFDRQRPERLAVQSDADTALTITPRLVLEAGDRDITEPGFWAFGALDTRSAALIAAIPTRGLAETVDIHADARNNAYFADAGLGLRAAMRRKLANAALALDLSIHLSADAEVTVADRSGIPLKMKLGEFHGFPYSTISEITVLPRGPCLSFPRGVAAWFDLSERGRITLTVRAAGTNRSELTLDVYPRSVATGRIFTRVLQEGQEFEKLDQYSAALARYRYVAENAPAELSAPLVAKARVAAIAQIRDRMRRDVDTSFDAAAAEKSPLKLDAALARARAFVFGFSADAEIGAVKARVEQLEKWKLAAVPARPPKEMEIAIAVAKRYYDDAVAAAGSGHALLALLLLDNVLRDYSDTPSYKDALKLHDEIMAPLNDTAKRDAAIDAELKAIDAACDREDWQGAYDRCRALFKRFPDTPRNRDIMQRLRRIEDKFKG